MSSKWYSIHINIIITTIMESVWELLEPLGGSVLSQPLKTYLPLG